MLNIYIFSHYISHTVSAYVNAFSKYPPNPINKELFTSYKLWTQWQNCEKIAVVTDRAPGNSVAFTHTSTPTEFS